MALLTMFQTFFISPFGEKTVSDELNTFLRTHRIINVEKKLIDSERGTGWVFLVEYGIEANAQNTKKSPKIDYKSVLSEQEFAVFEKLRELRKSVAEQNNVQLYVVFTNEQLVAMLKKPPLTENDILAIPNVGKSRKYGKVFIEFFASFQNK